MNIILYVGLPKTATTFYQTTLFPYLDNTRVIYNPHDLVNKMSLLIHQKEELTGDEILSFHAEINKIENNDVNKDKTLLIVNEHLGYVHWNPDPAKGSLRTKALFPDAFIIMSFRYQLDWLISLYGHHMDTGGCTSIKNFLNFDGERFIKGESERVLNQEKNEKIVSIDIFALDWTNYIKCFYNLYGDNIKILFFEDFLSDKKRYTRELLEIIGVKEERPDSIDFSLRINRRRSALGCKLTEFRCIILSFFGLEQRSIRSFNALPMKRGKRNILMKIIDTLRYGPFQYYMTWLEKYIYYDWDMLQSNEMRNKLQVIYNEMNIGLLKYVKKQDIPSKYIYKENE